jgi:hypothetical protein
MIFFHSYSGVARAPYFTGIFTGAPGIQAALIWIVTVPGAMSEGRRKFTW